MKYKDQIRHFLQNQPDSPGRTLLELLGQQRLVVEYHRGILGYSEEEILIKASYGIVSVTGRDLRLCSMSAERLCIRGHILQIMLTGRDGDGPVE